MELPVLNTPAIHLFDARGIAKRVRHAAIFGALEALYDGETLRFVNDHDPLPLLAQIRDRYGPQVSYAYQRRDDQEIVIDFTITLPAEAGEPAPAVAPATGGCGGNGGGCGCAGH